MFSGPCMDILFDEQLGLKTLLTRKRSLKDGAKEQRGDQDVAIE